MNGVLTHRIDGEGPPLLLLNGGLMSIPSWDFLMPSLTPHYCVVRCDFRGQLLSPGPPHETLAAHAQDLAILLEHLGIVDTHVFGTSYGGEVALLFAANRPDLVRSLTILTATDRLTDEMHASSRHLIDLAEAAANGGDGGEVVRAVLENTFSDEWLAAQEGDVIELRAAQIAKLPRSFFEGLVGLMKALDRLDLNGHLERITSPALVIGAEYDRVFPVEHSHSLADAISGARLRILDGSGHGAIIEMPGEIVAEMRAFHTATDGRG